MEFHIDEIVDTTSTKQISYDDILAKLNVKIVDGKMQYIAPVGLSSKKGAGAVDKTSYIYNKYFKKEMAESSERAPPKTREEYNQRLAEEMRKHALMKQAKSKKLMFYSNNNYGRSAMVDPDSLFRIRLQR